MNQPADMPEALADDVPPPPEPPQNDDLPRFPNLNDYGTIEGVVRVAIEHHPLSPKNMSAVWARLSKLEAASSLQDHDTNQLQQDLDTLFTRTTDDLLQYGPFQLSQVAISTAKIIKAVGNNHQSMFYETLIGENEARKIALFQLISDASVPLLQYFDPQGYSILSYACAIAGVTPIYIGQTLFGLIADAITAHQDLSSFRPQTLSNTVWAFATANQSHTQLFDRVAREIIEHRDLRSFKPQELANIVWAYATLQVYDCGLFAKVADDIASRQPGSFAPQELSAILWAYATAKVSHPRLFEKVADEVASHDLGSFKVEDLSNIVWSYATAKVSSPLLFDRIAGAIMGQELNSQDVSQILWAYATVGLVESPLFTTLAPRVIALLSQCHCQNLANIAWSYAVADVDVPEIFNERFITALVEKMDTFTGAQLCQLYQWHLWQQEEKSTAGLPLAFESICYEAFISVEPQVSDLEKNAVSVLSSIGLNPKEGRLTEKGYSLDALVEVSGKNVGVEVNGPSHFIGRDLTGRTMLKRRQISAIDEIALISVPYWEWDELGQDLEKKQNYLHSAFKNVLLTE